MRQNLTQETQILIHPILAGHCVVNPHQSKLKYPNHELQQQENLTSIFQRLLAPTTKAKFTDNRTAKDIK